MSEENIPLQEGEEIKPVAGYENLYSITSHGRVWSHIRYDSLNRKQGGLFLSLKLKNVNYLKVELSRKNKRKTNKIHRLVAIHFIPNPLNLPEVNHKDGNKHNNYLNNLEWCTTQENSNHSLITGLRKKETSKYYGVVFSRKRKRKNKWMSYTRINNKSKTIGYFYTELEAAKSYNKFITSYKLNKLLNEL